MSPSSSSVVGWILQEAQRCQHTLETDHQLWAANATFKKVIERCNLCSTKRGDSKKIMKSYEPKCHHWALLKVNNLKANE
ncbi:hypothetical protein AAG906_025525 [Vitis piasezkii]